MSYRIEDFQPDFQRKKRRRRRRHPGRPKDDDPWTRSPSPSPIRAPERHYEEERRSYNEPNRRLRSRSRSSSRSRNHSAARYAFGELMNEEYRARINDAEPYIPFPKEQFQRDPSPFENDFDEMPPPRFFDNSQQENQSTSQERWVNDREKSQLPEFDPDSKNINVHEWIRLFNSIAIENNWTVDDKKFHFANKLGGNARRWFMNTNMANEKWGTIKAAFKKAFPSDMHFHEQLTTMIKRVKLNEESMSTYFYHKIALINECGFNGQKAVSCLIGGLSGAKIRHIAFRQGFSTPEDLYTFLCKSEGPGTSQNQCTSCRLPNCNGRNCINKSKKDRTILNIQGQMYNVVLVNKYVVDAFVNDEKIIGYVSMDSDYVTIRQEDAWNFKLEYETSNKMLHYFGSNSIKAIGVSRARLQIDRGFAIIDIYIVSNSNQIIPLVIGRSFSFKSDIKQSIDDDGVHYCNIEEIQPPSENRSIPLHNKDFHRPSSSSYRKLNHCS